MQRVQGFKIQVGYVLIPHKLETNLAFLGLIFFVIGATVAVFVSSQVCSIAFVRVVAVDGGAADKS